MSIFSFAQSQRLEPKARLGVLSFGQRMVAQTDTSSVVFRLDSYHDFGTILAEEVADQYWVSPMYHDYLETPTYTMEHDYFRLNLS